MKMLCTCLDLHSAAGFTEAHVGISSHCELIGFPTAQVGEVAGGVGGVALQSRSHAAGGSCQVQLHLLLFLPVEVGRAAPTLQIHANTLRFTGTWTQSVGVIEEKCLVLFLKSGSAASLTCAEGDVGVHLGLALAADGCQVDGVRLPTLQLHQLTLVLFRRA